MAYYTQNYNSLATQYEAEHHARPAVTVVSKLAAEQYGKLNVEQRASYSVQADVCFFSDEKPSGPRADVKKTRHVVVPQYPRLE